MHIGACNLTRKVNVDAEFAVEARINPTTTKEAAKMAIKPIEYAAR